MPSAILMAGTRVLVALLLLFSVYWLLRGHNLPGGGFIGGLVGATGFVLYAIACSVDSARRALRVPPQTVAGVGLGIALTAGLVPLAMGDAPFTGQWLFVGGEVPGTYSEGAIALSTILVFDVGVYLTVLGSTLALVFALEEEV